MQIYRFLTGPDDAGFCHKVTEALNNGWQLYGNPAYAFNNKTGLMQCGQAVIRSDTGPHNPDIRPADH